MILIFFYLQRILFIKNKAHTQHIFLYFSIIYFESVILLAFGHECLFKKYRWSFVCHSYLSYKMWFWSSISSGFSDTPSPSISFDEESKDEIEESSELYHTRDNHDQYQQQSWEDFSILIVSFFAFH